MSNQDQRLRRATRPDERKKVSVSGAALAGVDWASEVHVVCVIDGDGAVTDRFEVTHDAGSLRGLVGRLDRVGVSRVAIERGDGPVVEELLEAGLEVFVVPSRQIKGLRSRYGSAGNKDDHLDAYVLADTLRTDGHRWKPLRPDHDDTRALRALCRSRKDLVETRVQIVNQLRANLEMAFPGAIGLFSKPDSPITMAFLRRFPNAEKAQWLSPKRLGSWLRSVGYTGGIPAAVLYGRLENAAPGLFGAEGLARAGSPSVLWPWSRRSTMRWERSRTIWKCCSALIPISASLPAFLARGWCAPPTCWPSSVIVGNGSPPMMPSLRWPAPRLPPASRASVNRPSSAGPATRNYGPPSWTSPTGAAVQTPGRKTSTSAPSTADVATRTPSGSWLVPGCGSSGDVGKTAWPSTLPFTAPARSSPLDIGHS